MVNSVCHILLHQGSSPGQSLHSSPASCEVFHVFKANFKCIQLLSSPSPFEDILLYCIVQPGLKFTVLLPQLTKCCGYGCVPPNLSVPSSDAFHFLFEQSLSFSWNLTKKARLAGLWASGNLPVSSSLLCYWSYKCMLLCLAFFVGSGGLNSNHHACEASLY